MLYRRLQIKCVKGKDETKEPGPMVVSGHDHIKGQHSHETRIQTYYVVGAGHKGVPTIP